MIGIIRKLRGIFVSKHRIVVTVIRMDVQPGTPGTRKHLPHNRKRNGRIRKHLVFGRVIEHAPIVRCNITAFLIKPKLLCYSTRTRKRPPGTDGKKRPAA